MDEMMRTVPDIGLLGGVVSAAEEVFVEWVSTHSFAMHTRALAYVDIISRVQDGRLDLPGLGLPNVWVAALSAGAMRELAESAGLDEAAAVFEQGRQFFCDIACTIEGGVTSVPVCGLPGASPFVRWAFEQGPATMLQVAAYGDVLLRSQEAGLLEVPMVGLPNVWIAARVSEKLRDLAQAAGCVEDAQGFEEARLLALEIVASFDRLTGVVFS